MASMYRRTYRKPGSVPSFRARKRIVRNREYGAGMDMLTDAQITQAGLEDWRKLGQGLHARYVLRDFAAGARFVAAVGEAGDALGHYPRVTLANGHVDLKLVSTDAVYRAGDGSEHIVEWVTQRDVTLPAGSARSPASTRRGPIPRPSPRSNSPSTPRMRRRSPRCGPPC